MRRGGLITETNFISESDGGVSGGGVEAMRAVVGRDIHGSRLEVNVAVRIHHR
jgi:hypothetical protein